jgi:hypothetical protein
MKIPEESIGQVKARFNLDLHNRYDSPMARSVRSACDCGSNRMGDQNLLSRAPPCFGRHVSAALAPTPVSKRIDVSQAYLMYLFMYGEQHVRLPLK